ncbi:MAG: 4-hydroxythreonine-4-phosphate dehydrogenase PdxA [Nitrospirota bacterium]
MELPFDERDIRPVLAITMGDPAGIGPEIILKALNVKAVVDCCRPVIIGNLKVLEDARGPLPLGTQRTLVKVTEPGMQASDGAAQVVDVDPGFIPLAPGKPTAAAGHISVACIRKAVQLALDKKVDAVVTAPITKETLKMAGYPYPGHTELLAELTGAKDYAMMLTGGADGGQDLRVVLATIHVALRDVPGLVKKERVIRAIRLAEKACRMMGVSGPRVAVCGLNPHAGEGGLFGDEEITEISPACIEARNAGINVFGPLPADTLFHRAYKGDFDAVVAMYHDQGLGPLKMFAFGNAVNVTLGLPIIRTSVDHGTAYDIAGKGIASPNSLVEAIRLAARMAGKRG